VSTAAAVLVTRPEPGGAETAARVAALGWEPVMAPALVLRSRVFVMPPAQAVLLTSRAAARALPPPVPRLPILAVGEATATEARARGWLLAEAAAGTAEDLARLAAGRLDPAAGPLLLAVGQGYSLQLADDLRRRGFRVIRRIAYAAALAASLPDAAIRAVAAGRVGYVLFHSPRSALCAMTLLRAAGLAAAASRMEVLAISRRVAEAAAAALAPLAWRAIRVADRPEEDALLRLLGRRDAPAGAGGLTRSGES
jgi:uroporphyrinogen-III synthase